MDSAGHLRALRAETALLVLWGRLDRADPAVGVEGDGEAVARVLDAAIVP
jgi:hypothetical protein